jgi:hypothetical protein
VLAALLTTGVVALAALVLVVALLRRGGAERVHLLRMQEQERSARATERLDLLDRLAQQEREHRAELGRIEERHAEAVALLIDRLEQKDLEHRNETRELLNRIQHPAVMPTGARAVSRAPDPDVNARDRARAAWVGVGRAEPLSPDGDGMGSEVP